MKLLLQPPIWLIILLVGLPIFSETVYKPSLPEIAKQLKTSSSMVEYTLSIYLAGFALGMFLWGNLSDHFGRKPCLLIGFSIYTFGCLLCYLSPSIEMLMVSRFIQAVGGGAGSILAQAITRDAFHGSALGKVYSLVGSALAIFPAIGPVIGGLIAEHFEWSYIFLFLLISGSMVTLTTYLYLPETNLNAKRGSVSLREVFLKILKDKRVLSFGLIVGICNGINFSYFAEGPFYLMENLGLTPLSYGISFTIIAAITMCFGLISKYLQSFRSSEKIMTYGLILNFIGSAFFTLLILFNLFFYTLPNKIIVISTILSMMIITGSICIITSNALSEALKDYKSCIGTASSIFGFYYYAIVSLITFFMGFIHDGTLLPMPLYFLSLSALMLLIRKMLI